MEWVRNWVDALYLRRRDNTFKRTADDPKIAHEEFVAQMRLIHRLRLENLLFNCSENDLNPGFELSNAAGFNKDGLIPPQVLQYLGFDRVVVGTVTGDSWKGNPRPTIRRLPLLIGTITNEELPCDPKCPSVQYRVILESLVNAEGLPGMGAQAVAHTMRSYGEHGVPITINITATPGKEGDALLKDLTTSVLATHNLHGVDRYEVNISCQNTGHALEFYHNQLSSIINTVNASKLDHQQVYLKVSPDITPDVVAETVSIAAATGVSGFVTTNTTTRHDYPLNERFKGGASGKLVYGVATQTQRLFEREICNKGYNLDIIAVGGIDSSVCAKERLADSNVIGIQIYTPLIFNGPGLLRELRRMKRE